MRGALLDRDGVLLLLDEEALYKKALELAAYGAGLERSLAVLARGMRTLEEAVRSLAVRTLEEEEALWRRLVAEAAEALNLPQERLLPWRYCRFMKRAPGAEALLRALKARGLKIGVLSNTLPSLQESLAHYVDLARGGQAPPRGLSTGPKGHGPEARGDPLYPFMLMPSS